MLSRSTGVGYKPDPWQWTSWEFAGEHGRFTGRWVAFDGPAADLRQRVTVLALLGFAHRSVYAGLPVIPGASNRAGVSPRCLACDKLVEHLSRQLRHAHATGLGDHPKLVACVL